MENEKKLTVGQKAASSSSLSLASPEAAPWALLRRTATQTTTDYQTYWRQGLHNLEKYQIVIIWTNCNCDMISKIRRNDHFHIKSLIFIEKH